MDTCDFCAERMNYYNPSNRDIYQVQCPRCGEYFITREALTNLKSSIKKSTLSDRQKANISGWLCENKQFEINTNNLDNLFKIKTPSFHERADKILLEFERMTEYAGHFVQCFAENSEVFYGKPKSYLSVGYCLNSHEFEEILEFLKDTKRISFSNTNNKTCKITANGWEHLEKLKKINADSQQGFVAMWFDKAMMEVYDKAISKGILDAGYKPHLVSDREHNDQIDDEIIAQIRRSRFILADFTGHRGGVYYEAGFAKGLGIEVVWTCREDDIDKLHFDIRQYNCILWQPDKLDELRKKICFRIESVLGRGSYQQA